MRERRDAREARCERGAAYCGEGTGVQQTADFFIDQAPALYGLVWFFFSVICAHQRYESQVSCASRQLS